MRNLGITRSTLARRVGRGGTIGSAIGIPIVLLLVLTATSLVIATPGGDHERPPRELHPRGEWSAEQMAQTRVMMP